MEAISGDVPVPTGFLAFAPVVPARGALFSARRRPNRHGESTLAPAVSEAARYGAERQTAAASGRAVVAATRSDP